MTADLEVAVWLARLWDWQDARAERQAERRQHNADVDNERGAADDHVLAGYDWARDVEPTDARS